MSAGPVGVVTGAGRGMGRACAARVASMVDVLLLVDRDESALAESIDELAGGRRGPDVEAFALDVTDGAGVVRLASRVKELGPLRAIAHAAGVSPTMADWRAILGVDLVGTALLIDAIRPLAVEGTAVVCFASMAPHLDPSPPHPVAEAIIDEPLDSGLLERIRGAVGPAIEDPGMAYVWAKRGVQRLVGREADGFGRAGARICSISPGIIDTPMGRQEADGNPVMKTLMDLTPLSRPGRPEEVAAAAAFLLSEDASFVNGADLVVDGGLVAALRSDSARQLDPPGS